MNHKLFFVLCILFVQLTSLKVSYANGSANAGSDASSNKSASGSENNCVNKTVNTHCIEIKVQDRNGQAIPNIVVYLEPLAGQTSKPSSKVVTVSQYDKAFSPYITVSQTNKKVNFVNRDDITHHIYSADNDNKFAFKIRAETAHLSDTFINAAEIAMGCNIHDWMSGYLLVVKTPYFAKTDEHGKVSFSLSKLGKYRVVIWHPKLNVNNHRVSQDYDFSKGLDFTFTVAHELPDLTPQKNDQDFDFLSDY